MRKFGLNILRICAVFCMILLIIVGTFPSVYAVPQVAAPKSIKTSFVSTGVKIKWSRVKSADGYYIYRKKSSSNKFTRIAKNTKNTVVTYTDKTAKSDNYYIYAVKAYKGKATSVYRRTSKKYYIKPPEISRLTNNYGSVTVKWKKVTGVTGYYLYRKTGNGKYKKIATIKGDSKVKYTDKTVVNAKKYTYSLKAYIGSKSSVVGVSKQLKFKKTKIKVSLDKTKLNLYKGQSAILSATPSIKDVSVKWTSSDTNVVSVNTKGKIKGLSPGTAKITTYFTYNQKKYKNSCTVTVKEKTYSIGDSVNLDGKLKFKLESVKAHDSCLSTVSKSGNDNLIVTYSYTNLHCGDDFSIDYDNFTVSDTKGNSGKTTNDCLHCMQPDACDEGAGKIKAVTTAVLKNKGEYFNLRLTVNIPDYGKLSAKFKLKIDRSDSELFSDKYLYEMVGITVNIAKLKAGYSDTFSVVEAVYQKSENFAVDGNIVKSPVVIITYSFGKGASKTTKHLKAWYYDKKLDPKKYYNCNISDGYLIVMPINQKPESYDGKIDTVNAVKASEEFDQVYLMQSIY